MVRAQPLSCYLFIHSFVIHPSVHSLIPSLLLHSPFLSCSPTKDHSNGFNVSLSVLLVLATGLVGVQVFLTHTNSTVFLMFCLKPGV